LSTEQAVSNSPQVSAPVGGGQGSGQSGSQQSSRIEFDHEMGTGPNLLADNPTQTPAPVTERPDHPGSAEATESQTQTAAKVADPVVDLQSYYDKLSGKTVEDPSKKTEIEPALSADAFKVLEANAEKVSSALKQAGIDDKAVEQIINANKLVGRQSSELGELRKVKEVFDTTVKTLDTIAERDPQSGALTGNFNGMEIIRRATEKHGAAVVNQQLEQSTGLMLVNASDYRKMVSGNQGSHDDIVREVAKKHGIDVENLEASDIKELMSGNVDAMIELTDRISDNKISERDRANVTARQTQAQKQQEAEVVTAKFNELKASVPHFAELEPVMQDLYRQYFANGSLDKISQLELLHLAAEGKSLGNRLPKIMEMSKAQIEKALLKRLGIPESEVFHNPNPQQPVQQPSKRFEFMDEFNEVGPALV